MGVTKRVARVCLRQLRFVSLNSASSKMFGGLASLDFLEEIAENVSTMLLTR